MRSALDRSHPWIVVCRKLPGTLSRYDTSDFPHVSVGCRVCRKEQMSCIYSDAVALRGSCHGGHLSVRCISQHSRSRFRQSGEVCRSERGTNLQVLRFQASKTPSYQEMTDAVFAAKLHIEPIIFGHGLLDFMVLMIAFPQAWPLTLHRSVYRSGRAP
jgi:hypothetical protein